MYYEKQQRGDPTPGPSDYNTVRSTARPASPGLCGRFGGSSAAPKTARGFSWAGFRSVQVRSCIGEVSCAAKYTRERRPQPPRSCYLLSKSSRRWHTEPAAAQSANPETGPTSSD